MFDITVNLICTGIINYNNLSSLPTPHFQLPRRSNNFLILQVALPLRRGGCFTLSGRFLGDPPRMQLVILFPELRIVVVRRPHLGPCGLISSLRRIEILREVPLVGSGVIPLLVGFAVHLESMFGFPPSEPVSNKLSRRVFSPFKPIRFLLGPLTFSIFPPLTIFVAFGSASP